MDPHQEKELDREIARELTRLPDISAPSTLIPRVMAVVAKRAAARWYRHPWQNWPLALRLASLALFLSLFAGACYGSWHAVHLAGRAPALRQIGELASGLGIAHSALSTVASAGTLAARQLGATVVLATCLAVLLGYVLCVGLSTLCVRLAFARR